MEDLRKLTDEQVAEYVRTKDQEAYREIMRRYQEKLMRYANYLIHIEMEAADIVQNAFIKAFVNLNGFDAKKKFPFIIAGFVLAILLAGWLINYTGLDTIWMRRGPMREFYQRYDGGMMRGSGWRMMQNGSHNKPGSLRGW